MAQTHLSKLLNVLFDIAENDKASHEERMQAIRQLAQLQQDRKARLAKQSSLLGQ